MSGQVISRPEREHVCSPGRTYGLAESGPFVGQRYGIPPSAYDYPKGTLWECECGKVWVSRAPRPGSPGLCDWRRETRRERRRRKRAATP